MQSIIHRCLAHRHAYEANILHRDLSPGNIIIDEKGKGLLIDWDLSKPVTLNGEETPRCATRTVSNDYLFPVMINANPENGFQGTWQFMSANLIIHPNARHEFIDDLESSLYVLLWVVMLYSPVTPKNRVPPFLATIFGSITYQGVGPAVKIDFLTGNTQLLFLQFPHRDELHGLVYGLADLFRARYVVSPTPEDRQLAADYRGGQDSPEFEKRAYCRKYDLQMEKIGSHEATINLFDTALKNRTGWPLADGPQKQVFDDTEDAGRQQPTEPVLKTVLEATGGQAL